MTASDGEAWAKKWIEVVEESSSSSDDVLRAGFRLVRNRPFTDIEVAPGFVSGQIEHRGATYTAQLGVGILSDDEWGRFCEQLLVHPTNAVAILLGELPIGCGSSDADSDDSLLIPAANELYPDCNCGDWNGVCGHAAALLYEVANLVESDPFVLTTIRGRGRYELKSTVEAARIEQDGQPGSAGVSGHPRGQDPGVPAAAAYRSEPKELPTARRLPLQVGEPLPITVPPPVDSGVNTDDIYRLIVAASERARSLLYVED